MKSTEEPMRYKHLTRLGNWYERQILEESKMKDYLDKKQKNELVSDKQEDLYQQNYKYIKLSEKKDSQIHYGDYVMIQSQQNMGYLVNDITDKVTSSKFSCSYSVFTRKERIQCRRSVFRLMPAFDSNIQLGEIIKYGQRLSIQAHEEASDQKLCLNSGHITPTRQSKVSKKQEVILISDTNSAENVWCIEHHDPKYRFKYQNQPVNIHDPLLIKHIYTQQWLASDSYQLNNSFGKEYEVYCHSYFTLNKTQNLKSEQEGRSTIDETLRQQLTQNSWKIITDNKPQVQTQVQLQQQTEITIQDLINILDYNIIKNHGLLGFRKFSFYLDSYIQQNGDLITLEIIRQMLINNQIQLHTSQIQIIYNQLINNGQKTITQLKDIIIKPLSNSRLQIVKQVYQAIKNQCKTPILLKDIAKLYNPNKDPQVLNKTMTEGQVFNQFMMYWKTQDQQSEISEQEFIDYYKDISNAMERDDHFEFLIRTAWPYN